MKERAWPKVGSGRSFGSLLWGADEREDGPASGPEVPRERMENARIDIDRLARRGETLAGQWPLSGFERLASLLADTEGEVRWRARARKERRREGGDDTFLDLAIESRLHVPCVRCLGPVAVDVDDAREFLLVADEETAERLDDPESELEVVAADTPFRLAELVEDELILAIPPLPRHEACELPAGHGRDSGPDSDRDGYGESPRRPFEGLAKLRGGGDETD